MVSVWSGLWLTMLVGLCYDSTAHCVCLSSVEWYGECITEVTIDSCWAAVCPLHAN